MVISLSCRLGFFISTKVQCSLEICLKTKDSKKLVGQELCLFVSFELFHRVVPANVECISDESFTHNFVPKVE